MTDDEFDPSNPYVRRQGRAGGGWQKGQAMTFNDWWKTYIADPGRADLRFAVQAETAALDAWEAAQAAQLPTGWPRASISDSRIGWTLDYKFLDKVEQIAKSRTEYSTSMEATEQVLIAALEVLATAAIDAASVAKEGQNND